MPGRPHPSLGRRLALVVFGSCRCRAQQEEDKQLCSTCFFSKRQSNFRAALNLFVSQSLALCDQVTRLSCGDLDDFRDQELVQCREGDDQFYLARAGPRCIAESVASGNISTT